MVTMYDVFNDAVKDKTREMKGYVEVLYTNSTAKRNAKLIDYPAILKIGDNFINPQKVFDDDRIGVNYATLEQDYFRLDGSFVLPTNAVSRFTMGYGYTSNDTFEKDDSFPYVPLKISTSFGETRKVNGVTLYFRHNKPLDLEIKIISGTTSETFTTKDIDIKENGTSILTFSDRIIDIMEIYVKDVLYHNRRIRLQEVDFGISNIYEDETLISFNTLEQCPRFSDEIPIKECEVVIGDYQDKFDYVNPKGITKYLTDGVQIRPYVGVKTKENGVIYCPQGVYFLDNWKKNKKEVTLTGKGFLNKVRNNIYIANIDMISDINDTFSPLYSYYQDHDRLSNDFKTLTISYINEPVLPTILNPYPKLGTGLDMIRKTLGLFGTTIYEMKRQTIFSGNDQIYNLGVVTATNSEPGVVKTIDLDIMKDYQDIKVNEPIKQISINEYQYKPLAPEEKELYNTTIMCNGEETLVYDYGKPVETETKIICDDYSKLEILDARNHIYDANGKLLYEPTYGGTLLTYSYARIRYNGKIQFVVNQGREYQEEKSQNVVKYNPTGISIEIDNDLLAGDNARTISNYVAKLRHDTYSKYSTSFTYNGDPSLDLGDNIKVESKIKDSNGNPQYDIIYITKIQNKFDGGFESYIEGDILEK